MNYYYFAVVLTVFLVHFISAETDHGKNEKELWFLVLWLFFKVRFLVFYFGLDSHACAQPLYTFADNKPACLALIKRWYHNHASGKCEEFFYDGCNKNENHFETIDDCKKTCDEWHKEHKDHHHGTTHEHDHSQHSTAHDHSHHHH